MNTLVRSQLGNPKLGTHRWLSVTVIVSTTLQELQSGAGQAVTATGTLLPIPDLIRMAAHAWHYLAVFDQHTQRALYLGRTKRLATADQRIVLHARDRGCTCPGCDRPGALAEAHHAARDWRDGGHTNIDDLALGCGPHNRLVTNRGWSTRKRTDGHTEWIPPPGLPLRGGVNHYHHPERYLTEPDTQADDQDKDA